METFVDDEEHTDAKIEWIAMRGLLLNAAGSTQETFYAQVIYPDLASYPILGKIATIGVTVPVTSVNCERAIGTYNSIKSDGRASLKVSSAKTPTLLNLEAPSVRTFPYEEAFKVWTLTKQRAGFTQMVKRVALEEAVVRE